MILCDARHFRDSWGAHPGLPWYSDNSLPTPKPPDENQLESLTSCSKERRIVVTVWACFRVESCDQ